MDQVNEHYNLILLKFLNNFSYWAGVFEPFLKSYIAHFQYKSLLTSDFIEYIKGYFENTPGAGKLELVDWETWLRAPGLPPVFAK